ncbi:Uncharacterised protein [Chlamydia trachomatis]|nr:Uncharacterised protein [Chlamydia trachomatis]
MYIEFVSSVLVTFLISKSIFELYDLSIRKNLIASFPTSSINSLNVKDVPRRLDILISLPSFITLINWNKIISN